LVFGLGFVLFGVGSGTGGIGDIMQNFFSSGGGSSGSSLSSLQKKVKQHPKDATAWRNLTTKLEADQKTERALIALEHYAVLKPKDESALQELAGLYQRRAQDYNDVWARILGQQLVVPTDSIFAPRPNSPLGKAFANRDPISKVLLAQVNTKTNAARQKLAMFTDKAQNTYVKLVKLSPANATYQFQLASLAQSLGRNDVATKAYKAFLKLAPNDSLASTAKQQLKVMAKSTTKVTTTGTATKVKTGG
jgi:tetratricopeptide (TPR) repeat protein